MGFIKKRYEASMIRQEEHPYFVYFTIDHCPGLKREPYTFKSDKHTLHGYFYHYDNFDPNIIVIFCHGIGGGHSSYIKEVNELAKLGYRVLAYDNTGCVSSEGDTIYGLSNSLKDLDFAIQSLKNSGELKDKKLYVVGHSWGGFAASNILNYHDVDKVVAISPFISLSAEYHSLFKGILGIIVPHIIKLEENAVGKWARSSAVTALNKENAHALVIHSKDDKTVLFKNNTAVLRKKVHNPNVKFYIVSNKDHHPQYTKEAVDYFDEVFGGFDKGVRDGTLKTDESRFAYFKDKDFNAMTIQDSETWKVIKEFLK